ncbi:MAG TPA: hypothetical protein VNN74_11515 [Candidatus Micrarchaeia archaeon]|nr:hypothetical protein [Candidatus Micrarchaeia archaeon]
MNTVLAPPEIAASTLEALVRQHVDTLVTYATHLVGDPQEAIDYVAAGVHQARRFPPSSLEREGAAVLFRAVTRACRQRQRFPPEPRGLAKLFRKPVPLLSLGADVASAARVNTVKRALMATAVDRRAALLLRDLAGLDYRGVGIALECSPETAARLVAAARREFGGIYRDISF